MKVYLDNGATTKVDPKVAKAMLIYLTEKYGNASSLYSLGQESKKALESSRKIIANELNALPEEIVFTGSGTEADNIAILGIVFANKDKNHIISSKIEHPAVLQALKHLEDVGYKVTYLDVDKDGFISLKDLESSITDKTLLVTIMHANNEIGTIQDIKAIGDICKKHNIYFHTDAIQSFTKTPIDVKKINIDLISLSSHKIHGPKGVGALFIKKATKINNIIYGGGQESNLRSGTENIPSIIGFAEAVKIDKKLNHIKQLRDYFIKQVLKIPHTKLNGSKDKRLVNNANISFAYIEGESLLMHLDNNGIAVSTGSACSSHSLEPSHVLKAINLPNEYMNGTIRFTFSRFNTKKEIDYSISKLKKIVSDLRKISPLKGVKNV